MCMCAVTGYNGEFGGSSIGCPIKCKDDNGQTYPFIGFRESCSCLICTCKYAFVCTIKNIDKVIMARKAGGCGITTQNSHISSSEV